MLAPRAFWEILQEGPDNALKEFEDCSCHKLSSLFKSSACSLTFSVGFLEESFFVFVPGTDVAKIVMDY